MSSKSGSSKSGSSDTGSSDTGSTDPGSFGAEPFDSGWSFSRAELDPLSELEGGQWLPTQLPHDWAIAGPFDPEGDGSTGKLPWEGEGWYKKSFDLDLETAGKRVYLDFDGVMAFPKVYINGQLAGEWDYGYTPFRIDATDFVNYGASNTVLVHVDTRKWGSRWYPGAGIYRSVGLTIAEPVHIAQWGTRVRTNGDELSGARPSAAAVETTIENHSGTPLQAIVHLELVDPDGTVLSELEESVKLPSWGKTALEQSFQVDGPALWDVDDPQLYTVRTSLVSAGRVLDRTETRFGFRTFAFTADDGFHLNGRRVQIYGVNLHHDLGPLGAAFNRSAAERQLRIMMDMGANALRTSHNPASREMIELCDELGILVFNEVFDKWEWTAGRRDHKPPLAEFGHRHIRNTVLRDRNSPSVVAWSVGNEIGSGEGVEGIDPTRVAMMAGFVRAYDSTRPVGMGNHIPGLVDGNNYASLDLTGWNYARRYARYRQLWPDRPIIYTETASTVSTRGFYDPLLPYRKTDYSDTHQVSSYDLNAAEWSDIPDHEFRLLEEDRFLAGEFVWTGMDYLGEPTPFVREARSSYFGIVDLCGIPKDRFFLYRSHWRPEEPTVHILPHWNWPDRVSEVVPVFVYTNGDSAELFLNGRSLGMRRKGEVPVRGLDLAASGRASASSLSVDAGLALGNDLNTSWTGADNDSMAWWQVDLGAVQDIGFISLDTPLKENLYAYTIEASGDGEVWATVVEKPTAPFPRWEGPSRIGHAVTAQARFVRLRFTGNNEDAPIGLRTFRVFTERSENEYYDVTYDYRLRWNEVVYEPGELRAVAYKDGEIVGDAVVRTTGAPRLLRATSETEMLHPDQLAFVRVEALDGDGNQHPLADQELTIRIEGPADPVGVCNGNPLSMDAIQSSRVRLFNGKALVVVRPRPQAFGTVRVHVSAAGLEEASVELPLDPR